MAWGRLRWRQRAVMIVAPAAYLGGPPLPTTGPSGVLAGLDAVLWPSTSGACPNGHARELIARS